MAIKETSPETDLGGFKLLSNMLTGSSGPQDLDDPIVDPKDINFDDDDDDLEGAVDLDDDDKDDKDPVVEPTDDDDDVDPIVDPKPDPDDKDDKDDKDDDTTDLSEHQEDIANYLKDELEANLGWDIPEDYEIKSVEDVVKFMGDLAKEASTPNYANEEVAKYDQFVKDGGNLRDFYKSTVDNRVSTEDINIESEFNQKIVLKEHMKNQGYSEAQIDRRISRYDEAGVLEDEASDALEMLKDYNEKAKVKLLEDQNKEAARIKNEQLSFITNVEDNVKGLESIRGVKISEKERQELLDYVLKTDSSGMTQYQKEYMSDIKNLVESAYFTKNGRALIEKSKKQGKTEAYRSLNEKLNSNKGNKGKSNMGRDYSDSASSGLSLLGKQLIGNN